jgi:glucokinase
MPTSATDNSIIAAFGPDVNHDILRRMSMYIAVDIGGTRLRAAVYPQEGLTAEEVTRIHTKDKSATPLDRLLNLLSDVWPTNHRVQSIGVAVPGPTDPYRGVVIETANIPGWENLPLKQILEERFGVPVALGNDANLAALGEWRYGAGQGHHDMIYVTVSTGIGSGIIIADRLLLGAHGLAAELGHVTVLLDGPVCSCGQRGHLEALASGTAMLRWIEEQLKNGRPSRLIGDSPLTGKKISQAAEMGDNLAIQALERSGTYMGIALADHLHIFNPTAVVIGGGVSQSGDFLLAPLKRAMEAHVMAPQYLENLKISRAMFGDEAGLIGALTLAREYSPVP